MKIKAWIKVEINVIEVWYEQGFDWCCLLSKTGRPNVIGRPLVFVYSVVTICIQF